MEDFVKINIEKAGIFFPAWTVESDRIRCKSKEYLFKDMKDLQVAFNKVNFRSADSLFFNYNNVGTLLWAKTKLDEKLKLLDAFEYIAQFVNCHAYGEKKMAVFYLAIAKALSQCKDEYISAIENEEHRVIIETLYEFLPELYSKYVSAVLNAPLQLTIPRSPQSAAFLGTMIGGTAVGVMAGLKAIEKEKAYEKNRIDVIKSQLKNKSASDALISCTKQIESILLDNEETKEVWRKKKRETYIDTFNSL